MNFFDDTLAKVFNLIESVVSYIEDLVGVNFIRSVSRVLEQIHSMALLISVVIALIAGIKLYGEVQAVFPQVLYLVILSPVILLVASFFSETFHEANEDLISANKTTLSNPAYFRFSGFLVFILAIAGFIGGIITLAQGTFGEATTYVSLGIWANSIFLLLNCAPLFNPSFVNVEIDQDSSSGEDFIAFASFSLKTLAFFEKIISRLFIITGAIYLLINIFQPNNIENAITGYVLLLTGILFPVIVYFLFIFLYFWFSLILSLLRLGRTPRS